MAWSKNLAGILTSQPDYIRRVQGAFMEVAIDVLQENESVDDHAERVEFANQVLGSGGMPPRAPSILHELNPALTNTPEPSDSDIVFTVTQQWNYFAGISPPIA